MLRHLLLKRLDEQIVDLIFFYLILQLKRFQLLESYFSYFLINHAGAPMV